MRTRDYLLLSKRSILRRIAHNSIRCISVWRLAETEKKLADFHAIRIYILASALTNGASRLEKFVNYEIPFAHILKKNFRSFLFELHTMR